MSRHLIAIVLAGIFAMLLAGCGGDDKGASVRTATASPTGNMGTPSVNESSWSDNSASSTETPTPGQVITTVEELVRRFGWPPDVNYAHMRIPSIGVDAKIGVKVVGRDGVMANPHGPADVVWYDMGQWNGMGGRIGEGGNSIFSGHVDYNYPIAYAKGVRYRGHGVFSKIRELKQGDVIEIERDGKRVKYAVVWQKQLAASANTGWGTIWSSDVPKESITLYTCGGAFDSSTAEYSDRVIVRAERV